MTNNDIAIKWSGSKRSQASEIISHFPKEIKTYHEPFCGGCSVLYELLNSDIKCEKYVVSDLNYDLVHLWDAIISCPNMLADNYECMWMELSQDNDIERKKEYYNEVRKRFNENGDSSDFLFLMRTCANGMPRYNSKGDFNTPFHLTRNGIQPEKLRKTLLKWSKLLRMNNVEFNCCSYEEIKPKEGDFVYLDPPYANTKGMYFGGLELNPFFNFLKGIPCGWALSFDGISGKDDNTYDVPKIYDEHLYLKSGNSSFKRLIGSDKDAMVYESLYLKNR